MGMIIYRTVIVTPHSHIFLGLAVFVRGVQRGYAPSLQSTKFPEATVKEDVSLSVNPVINFADSDITEPNTFLRSDLGRPRSNKDASKRAGTTAANKSTSHLGTRGHRRSQGYRSVAPGEGETGRFGSRGWKDMGKGFSQRISKADLLPGSSWATGGGGDTRTQGYTNGNTGWRRSSRIKLAIEKSTTNAVLRHGRGGPNTVTRRRRGRSSRLWTSNEGEGNSTCRSSTETSTKRSTGNGRTRKLGRGSCRKLAASGVSAKLDRTSRKTDESRGSAEAAEDDAGPHIGNPRNMQRCRHGEMR
jgi:hypothetical protein